MSYLDCIPDLNCLKYTCFSWDEAKGKDNVFETREEKVFSFLTPRFYFCLNIFPFAEIR